jgi:hypothetical protein
LFLGSQCLAGLHDISTNWVQLTTDPTQLEYKMRLRFVGYSCWTGTEKPSGKIRP